MNSQEPRWVPLKSAEPYEEEMDISTPHGNVRHRRVGDAEWQAGPAPVSRQVRYDLSMPPSPDAETRKR